jgi:zinc protease
VALAVWIVLLTGAVSPSPARAGVFNPQTFTLANGLQGVVIVSRRMPVVTHMIWYRVGAVDEPEGRSGIAHLLEHLMFKGTDRHAEGEFSRIVARHGGNENAFTSHDFTAYFQTVAKERLGLMMGLEADRMRNLVLTEEQVARERQVVLEERLQRVENDPGAILDERADAMLFVNVNYRRPVIGWEHEIRDLELDEVRDFYRRWYTPANAILVVAGDVDVDAVRELAKSTYGTIGAEPPPPRRTLTEPPPVGARRISLADPRVTQPSWDRRYLAPSYRSGAAEHAYPLEVLAEVLGGSTGRLYRDLVVDRGLAVSAGAGYDPAHRGPTAFTVYASPRPGTDLAAIEAAVDRVLAAIVADAGERSIDGDELERAKRRLIAESVYARDSLSTGAHILGEALSIGQTIDEVESWPKAIAAVTRNQVIAAAEFVLRPDRAVTALLTTDGDDGHAAADVPAVR